VKITHQRNSIRDGNFVFDFSCLIGNEYQWLAGETLVGRAQAHVEISKAFEFQGRTFPRQLHATDPSLTKFLSVVEMGKMIARIGNFPRTHADSRPSHPSQWRDLSFEVRLAFYHFAMRSSGSSYKFDLNLSPDLEMAAYAQGEFAREFLHRRIARGSSGDLIPIKPPKSFCFMIGLRLTMHQNLPSELHSSNGEWFFR
jgi:hypothetical protein